MPLHQLRALAYEEKRLWRIRIFLKRTIEEETELNSKSYTSWLSGLPLEPRAYLLLERKFHEPIKHARSEKAVKAFRREVDHGM